MESKKAHARLSRTYPYSTVKMLDLHVGVSENGNISISYDSHEDNKPVPMTELTRETEVELPFYQALLDPYGENSGMVHAMKLAGLGRLTDRVMVQAQTIYPVFQFNPKVLYTYCIDGCAEYEEFLGANAEQPSMLTTYRVESLADGEVQYIKTDSLEAAFKLFINLGPNGEYEKEQVLNSYLISAGARRWQLDPVEQKIPPMFTEKEWNKAYTHVFNYEDVDIENVSEDG